MDGTIDITIKNQHLSLLPQRAVFWNEQKMLVIADPHFGKTTTFRRNGIAIPGGITADDLKRLDRSLVTVGAKTLLVLGDLMHAAVAADDPIRRQLSRWRRARADIEILLVSGNHDLGAGPPPPEFGIRQVLDRLISAPFCFVHHPQQVSGSYVLGGHLHPAARLTGTARQREWLPCFYFGRAYAVLPAFGGFTGHSTVRPGAGDRVFVIADNRIVEPGADNA